MGIIMENKQRIGLFLIIIGIIVLIYGQIFTAVGNIGVENMVTLISFIIAVILMINGVLLLIIKKKPQNLQKESQEKEREDYCKTCGAEILDKSGEFCSKCGAPLT